MIDFPSPILSVASDVISELDGPDAVYGLWTLFTKCKQSLKDGRRLENISWRLWYREFSASQASSPHTPGSSSPPLSDYQAYSPITPSSEDDGSNNGQLGEPPRESLITPSGTHTAHSWHGQNLAPSCPSVCRRLSTASMPTRPIPKSTSRAGKIIIEILPDTWVVPPLSSLQTSHEKTPASGTTTVGVPTLTTNSPQESFHPQRPVISVPGSSSPSTSLGYPRVVVVNPTPHPTPPATPHALRPLVTVHQLATGSTHLLPPPARRSLHSAQLSSESSLSSSIQKAPALVGQDASAAASSAAQPSAEKTTSGEAPPSPSSTTGAEETLKPADRRFFLQQSESPDERSPDAESSMASSHKHSDAQSPSSEASSQMRTNVTQASRRAAALGKARARKSREVVRHGPARAMAQHRAQGQRQVQSQATTQQKKQPPPVEPKKIQFDFGSTSSTGSRETGDTEHSAERRPAQETVRAPQPPPPAPPPVPAPAARQPSPPKKPAPVTTVPAGAKSRVNGQVPTAHTKNQGGKAGSGNRRGFGIAGGSTDSEFETTDIDDDESDWASEESPDEEELARQREETRLREAAEEARRQRDMFAKVPKRSYTTLNRTRSGLLSQLMNPDPSIFPPGHPFRTSYSSQDMTQFGRATRPVAPALTTSKSSVAVPLAAQVTAQAPSTTTTTNGGYRPKGRPQGQEMEDDSDSDDDESGENMLQLPRSLAQQKLAALADSNRRRQLARKAGPPPTTTTTATTTTATATAAAAGEIDHRHHYNYHTNGSRPVLPTIATAPIALGYPYNLPAPAPPMTPRTTRRQMLSTELSESLRRNLLWERQVSKINMTGGARRGGGVLGGGLRPLTSANSGDGSGEHHRHQDQDHNHRRHHQLNGTEKEERKRAAMARNRSWADDYHTSGW